MFFRVLWTVSAVLVLLTTGATTSSGKSQWAEGLVPVQPGFECCEILVPTRQGLQVAASDSVKVGEYK